MKILDNFHIRMNPRFCHTKYPKQESDKKNPDEGKDLVIDRPFFHESQIYPPYNCLLWALFYKANGGSH
jgi:hypothetical protein